MDGENSALDALRRYEIELMKVLDALTWMHTEYHRTNDTNRDDAEADVTDVRWEGMSHQEIWDRVMAGRGPNASGDTSGAWLHTKIMMQAVDSELAEATARITGRWQGPAADATQAALTPLGAWVVEAIESVEKAYSALYEQADQVLWVRNNLPKPAPPTDEAFEAGDFLEDWQAMDARRDENGRQAVHVMQTYAANSERIQGSLLPISVPPSVVHPAGSAADGNGVQAFGPPGRNSPAAPPFGPGPVDLTAGRPDPGRVPAPSTVPAWQPPPVVASEAHPPSVSPSPSQGNNPNVGGGPNTVAPMVTSPPGATPSRTDRPAPPPSRPAVPGPPPPVPAPPSWRTHPEIRRAQQTPGAPAPPRWGAHQGTSRPDAAGSRTGADAGTRRGTDRLQTPRENPRGENPRTGAPGESTRGAATRSAGHPGMMPMGMGMGGGGQGREHRRPAYLVDDTDAFADDRWFTEQVITPDNGPPPRQRRQESD